ncbi:unnamed protein product [Linum trigynum]|uniref:RNase H type-1 domain-containing protein n=1 Tax=Linum trigynum TaxID=586398 RepID=A0AAV2GEV8_9ROSI
MDYGECLKHNINNNSLGNWPGEWASYFSLILWFIWKQRNEKIFQGKALSLPSLFHYVTAKAKEWAGIWEAASRKLDVRSKAARSEELIGWKPPPVGWLKLNTDGAAQGHGGEIGAGGVIRNSNGDWIKGFVCRIGAGSVIMAELWGILRGINLARRMGIEFLIIESDSRLALDLIQQPHDPTHLHASILADIRRTLAQNWVVQLVHSYREGNRVADWLSKHSLVYPFGMHELDDPPKAARAKLREDVIGVSIPRMVIRQES